MQALLLPLHGEVVPLFDIEGLLAHARARA
jgi:hypothetical protein